MTCVKAGSDTFQVTGANNCGKGAIASTTSTATVTGTASTYASTVIGDGPSLYYRFDDSAGAGSNLGADSSGNGRDGTYSGSLQQGKSGALANDPDTAMDSGNYSGQLQYLGGSGLPTGSSARTVEVWVNANRSGAVADYGTDSTNQRLAIYVNAAYSIFVNTGNNGGASFTPRYNLTSNTWHQVTVTYDGATTMAAYFDGIQAADSPKTLGSPLNTAGGTLYLPNNIWDGNGGHGGLDEFAMYPSALTATQVTNHFNASGNTRPSAPAPVTATGGSNQATISWTASSSIGSAVYGYLVQCVYGGVVQNSTWVSRSATQDVMTGLKAGSYTFQVTGANNFGKGATASTTSTATVTGTASTYASTVIGDGPSLYYRFDDSAGAGSNLGADSSGNGRDGTYSGSLQQGKSGALANDPDTAMDSGNYSGQLQYLGGSGLPTGSSARTVEVGVNANRSGAVADYGPDSTNQRLAIYVNAAYSIFVNTGNNGGASFTPRYNLTSNTWHQVTVTYDGATTMAAYFDGIQAADSPKTLGSPLNTAGGTLYLPNNIWDGNGGHGGLDEFAMYPSALTATQVTNHFNASGNTRPSAPAPVTATGGSNQATISWTASSSIGSAVYGYLVQAVYGGVVQNSTWVSGSATQDVMTGLKAGSYTFQVTGANNFGKGATASSTSTATVTGTASTYASTVIGDGPSLYYRFDDSAGAGSNLGADSSGNGRDGTYSGSLQQGKSGALANDPDTAMDSCNYNGQLQYLGGSGL